MSSELQTITLVYNDQEAVVNRPNSFQEAVETSQTTFPQLVNASADAFLFVTDNFIPGIWENVSWTDVAGNPLLRRVVVRTPSEAQPTVPQRPAARPISHRINTSSDNEVADNPGNTSDSIEVVIQISREEIRLQVPPSANVNTLKSLIQEQRHYILPGGQQLFFSGMELEGHRTLESYGIKDGSILFLVLKLRKPVIYLFPPSPLKGATVDLILSPHWQFSALYPLSQVKTNDRGEQAVRWHVDASPDGTLFEHQSKSEVSYLFWEAEPTLKHVTLNSPAPSRSISPIDTFDPSHPTITPVNSVLLTQSALTPYLDQALKALSLHTEARSSFITFWLPSFLKYTHIAIRFLPQKEYERTASLVISPTPDIVTRVFMVFRGVRSGELGHWEEACKRTEEGVNMWKDIVGIVDSEGNGEGIFRVLEWGGVEVL